MELWEHLVSIYYKCQCMLNCVHVHSFQHVSHFLIEHEVLHELVVSYLMKCIQHMTIEFYHL
jgi:hypothetical protein